jgi:hypothetical protein
MPEHIRQVRELRRSDGDTVRSDKVVDEREMVDPITGIQYTAARLVWFVAAILLAILLIRFVLALLGANPANEFARFIYSISYPFVAPFFGLFGYNLHYGVSRFESYTLVAIVVYMLIAWAIARLITINHPDTA